MTLYKVYVAATPGEDDLILAAPEDELVAQPDTHPVTFKNETAHSFVHGLPTSFTARQVRTFYQNALKKKIPFPRLSRTSRHTIVTLLDLAALLYVFVSVPFRIGFLYNPFNASDTERRQWTWRLSVLSSLDFVVDFIAVVNFIKVYGVRKNETKFTLLPGQISGTWEFGLEIFALLPFELIPLVSGAFNALHVVRLTKLCRTYKLRHVFTQLATIYSEQNAVQQLFSIGIKNLIQNILFCAGTCHYAACGYMFLGHAQCGGSLQSCVPGIETSWVVRDRLFGATTTRKYARTIYWASRTMVLLGYDDVTPVSTAETVYVLVIQLVGALFSSSLLATFLFLFKTRNAKYAAYSAHVDSAQEYMHSRNIPRAIRHQVMAYFSYSWHTHHSLQSEEALHVLPKHLQSKVTATLKASRIRQVCFLAKRSVEFINSLALTLERRVYSPTDYIIESNAKAQMFFIIRGNVTVYGANPRECSSGDYFAEFCLLWPEHFDEKAVAKSFCDLYLLAQPKFYQLVTQFHPDNAHLVLAQMAEILDKYNTQQRKMKMLLGGGSGGGSNSRELTQRLSEHQNTVKSKNAKRTAGWASPESSFRVYWEMIRLVAIVYLAFEVPYHAVFVAMIEGENMLRTSDLVTFRYICTISVEVFFAIDIFLRARYFVYVDPIALLQVTHPSLIFASYRQNGFYLDLAALLPVGLIVDALMYQSWRTYSWILRLPRLLRLRLLPTLLRDVKELHGLSSKLYLFLNLLFAVSLTLHFIAISWFEMAWIPRGLQSDHKGSNSLAGITRGECLRYATLYGNCSWVKYDCFGQIGTVFPAEDNTSIYDNSFVYIRAVYWAVVALTAVGYGDILAYSTAESLFAAVWIFVGGIINFAVLGAMSSTISNALAARHDHLELLNTVNSIMGRLSISTKLSTEIRQFYNHQFKARKLAYESQLLANLPDQLSYQISCLLHTDAVKTIDLFDTASVDLVQELTGKFRHRTFENGETICLEGDVCCDLIVLRYKSKVNIFFKSRKVPVRALHEGDSYGSYEFLLRRPSSVTLTAASTVHASVMTREQFETIHCKFDDELREIKVKAHKLWGQQELLLRRLARNFQRQKLKPHVLQTPSLFYQRDLYGNSKSKRSRGQHAFQMKFTTMWRAGAMLWNAYNAFFVVFRIGFHSHLHFSSNLSFIVWVVDLCGDLYLAMDIYLRLYYVESLNLGNLIHHKYVNQGYRRSKRLNWDLIASLPLYVPASSGSLVVSICRLPRLIRLVDLWTYLDDLIVQVQQQFASRKVAAYLGPIKLMLVVAFAAHLVGSIFLFNSSRECETNTNCWLRNDFLIAKYDHALWIMYSKALYWAITTLFLTSSRDIASRDLVGTIFVILTCLGCSFAMGYIVGEITDLILGFNKETKVYKNRITNFESFAKNHELSEVLTERVKFFFHAQFERTQGHDLTQIVEQLPANLRIKFLLEIYGSTLRQLPITPFLTPSQVDNLALRFKSELLIPGDNILVEGTLGTRLCILHKGLAAAFWPQSVATVAVLGQGALFGEISFFLPGQRRLVTVRATTSCELLYISQQDWAQLWVETDDQADIQEQKYALHSILTWVNERLRYYQRRCTHVASKLHQELATRQEIMPQEATERPKTTTKDRSKVSTSSQLLYQSTSHRSNVSPEVLALERKTKYLLTKTLEYTNQLQFNATDSSSRKNATLTSTWHSSNRSEVPRKGSQKCTSGPQFFVDVNPVNESLRGTWTDDQVKHLENECWRRSLLMLVVQDHLDELLVRLMWATTSIDIHKCTATGGPRSHHNVSLSSSMDRKFQAQAPSKRRVSTEWDASKRTDGITTQTRMERCRSLPLFNHSFFQITGSKEVILDELSTVQAEIDFEVLQRCQRPQYEFHIGLYHHFRLWRGQYQHSRQNNVLQTSKKPKGKKLSVDLTFQLAKLRRLSAKVDIYPTNRLLVRHDSRRLEMDDTETKMFIQRVKQMGKIWDIIMLLIAVYCVVLTPFKACFPHDLSKLSNGILHAWTGLEILLDVMCLLDIVYRVRQTLDQSQSSTSSFLSSFCHFTTTNPGLIVDIAAILPLELLLSINSVRTELSYTPTVDSSWWTTRWVLRLNRMLLGRRVEPLSESVLQYVLFDCNIRVNEPVIHFIRAFASYLMMAHFLACLWFATSNYSMHQLDGISWLTTSGMLTYIESLSSRPVETLIRIVEDLPLGRKYLRSLLFSTECITTLYYGDVVSVNELELIAETIITIWCTYLYGVLVGAQGELLDSNVRLEANVEQNRTELQLYLRENEAPNELQRQIRAYFGHIETHSQGEKDFVITQGLSSVLYEEIVVAALRRFAVRVEVFHLLDASFLRALLVCLKYVVCCKGEDVVVAGNIDRSMYFIASGHIVVKNGSSESELTSGQFFGELALLYGVPRLATCVALDVTELYRLDHEPYERLLLDFPEYRARNKLTWSTFSLNHRGLTETFEDQEANAKWNIYRTAMELLAKVHDMDPSEIKDILRKCRVWIAQPNLKDIYASK